MTCDSVNVACDIINEYQIAISLKLIDYMVRKKQLAFSPFIPTIPWVKKKHDAVFDYGRSLR